MSRVEPRVPANREPSPALVRAQVARTLSSDLFSRSDRLSAFLRFIVERTLSGEGDSLKEQVIAVELYGKGPEFNTAADPIVRVDARRLRDRLREYYASAPHDDVLISVPRGSYAPVFEVNPLATPPLASTTVVDSPGRSRTLRVAVGVAALMGAMALGSGIWRLTQPGPPPIRLLTVTALPGSEGGPPDISPDGNWVAYGWTGPDFAADNDLWVKSVDGEASRQLTETPRINEIFPAWSPDGQRIAYVRNEGGESRGVWVVSPLGGEETRLTDWGWGPTWLPDAKSLVIPASGVEPPGLVHYVLATGGRRRLTTVPAGFVDRFPEVSPDGRTVAFVRSTPGQFFGGPIKAALFVVPLAGGEPVQLDEWVLSVGHPSWTPDGRELIYPRFDAGDMRAFRVAAAGGRATQAAGLSIGYTISTSGLRPGSTFRVAAIDARSDVGLRMVDLQAPSPGGRLAVWAQFCDSTRLDYPGSFSRDGGLLAFSSTRNGAAQIYIASRDGTRLRTVTTFNGISMGLPSWSPDGRSLVFDAIDDKGLSNLFVTGAEGGALKPLTHDGTRKGNPEWSRDGRWIYYEADTSGRPEIWKIPVAGGRPLQLTTQGGRDPREAPDGRSVYFLEAARTAWTSTTLNRVSVDGGNVRTILSGVWRGSWDVAETGIVFLSGAPGLAPDAARPDAIEFYSFEDGRIRRVGELPFPVMGRGYGPPRVLAVSPDGRWAVVSHMDHWTRDIVVFDNFR